MKNLYSFSKDAWFVKLYKWLYGVDPTVKYKNFCPLFWSLIITFIFLPGVVFAKLCGNLSSKFYKWNSQRKENKFQERKQKFLEKCNNELTPLEAYNIVTSKDWDMFGYGLSNSLYDKIYSLYREYKFSIPSKKKKLDIDWDLTLIIGLFIGLLSIIIYGLFSIKWLPIDWKLLGSALWNIFRFIIFVVGFYTIANYLFYNDKVFGFFDRVWDFIKLIASKIWHGIKIVIDMIKNIYNKNCPLIEWKDK